MKPIVAKDQVRLGLARCWQLAVSGMSYRMFRSGVTIATLALASAFVVHMLSYGILEHESERVAELELRKTRRVGQNLTRLSAADRTPVILRTLLSRDQHRLEEYRRFGSLEPAELDSLQLTAQQLEQTRRYFVSLPVAAHAVLMGDRSLDEVLDRLAQAGGMDGFRRTLNDLTLPPPLGNLDRFERLVREERPRWLALTERITLGHTQACQKLTMALLGRPLTEVLLSHPEQLLSSLGAAGYQLSRSDLAQMATFAARERDLRLIARALLRPEIAAAIARETNLPIGEINPARLAEYVDNTARARWLGQLLGPTDNLSAARLAELFAQTRRETRLVQVSNRIAPDAKRGLFGLSERNQWLAILSFLVCAVGVANAMLMSVTERFTEIATMKCLGAMDRFVMSMFVLEALIQGAVGGLIGLVLGMVLALIRASFEFGSLVFATGGATLDLLLAMGASLVLGVGLAALAAVGPAWVAARLAPMEAMRVE